MLHIAACPVVLSKVVGRPDGTSEKQGEQQFWKVFSHAPGAAMEVQRELQWYKEVERVVPSSQKFLTNENGETPPALFWKWHCELVKGGEKWMRDTATSCTIVATLIVTVMFAAAFTLPGGTDDNSGNPKFLQRNSFMVFVISDALSLFSSVTSVLMFLSILTSHYAEKDSQLICPVWAAAPVSLLASIPVTLFALLQFPLFVNMVTSTYGRGVFNRKTKGLFV